MTEKSFGADGLSGPVKYKLSTFTVIYVALSIVVQDDLSWGISIMPPGGTPYNSLYGEAPSERGTLFRLD